MNKTKSHKPVGPALLPDLPDWVLADLAEGERELNHVATLIDRAERCGIDCGPVRETHRTLADQYAAWRREFGPPDPTGQGPGGG